jgi:L-threonylcarbamoyladenylate synthase
MIARICDLDITRNTERNNIRAPGALVSHYSPNAKVVLDSVAKSGEGFIAMADIPTPSGVIRLASPNSIKEFARDFYTALRLGDTKKLTKVVVFLPEGDGLAVAIRDRATKASAGK